jgi:uncharacterized protein (DUF2236 family)
MTWKPIRKAVDGAVEGILREHQLPGIQYSEPAGDPGWFGPDSPVWYVHEHVPSTILGAVAASFMETLHPSTVFGSIDHSMTYTRVNGVPTKVPEKVPVRFGQSMSFFMATTLGSAPVATRAAAMVRKMHHRVHGERPDGLPYDTRDPELFRWNYVTVAWGFARAHELYHPNPLSRDGIDAYYREHRRVGLEMYGDILNLELPATKAEVDDYLATPAVVNKLAYSAGTVTSLSMWNPKEGPLAARPALSLLDWVIMDMLPDWARALFRQPPRSGRLGTAARRKTMQAVVDYIDKSTRKLPELAEARKRATATSVVHDNEPIEPLMETVS